MGRWHSSDELMGFFVQVQQLSHLVSGRFGARVSSRSVGPCGAVEDSKPNRLFCRLFGRYSMNPTHNWGARRHWIQHLPSKVSEELPNIANNEQDDTNDTNDTCLGP